MKTTLDLPDDLLVEAKAVAARRRTTLKDMVTHALRREIAAPPGVVHPHDESYEIGPHGILSLKKRGAKISPERIYRMLEDAEQEDFLAETQPQRP